jgi:hypothetical protein
MSATYDAEPGLSCLSHGRHPHPGSFAPAPAPAPAPAMIGARRRNARVRRTSAYGLSRSGAERPDWRIAAVTRISATGRKQTLSGNVCNGWNADIRGTSAKAAVQLASRGGTQLHGLQSISELSVARAACWPKPAKRPQRKAKRMTLVIHPKRRCSVVEPR